MDLTAPFARPEISPDLRGAPYDCWDRPERGSRSVEYAKVMPGARYAPAPPLCLRTCRKPNLIRHERIRSAVTY